MLIKYAIFKHVNEELFKHTGEMVDRNLIYNLNGCKLLVYLYFMHSIKSTNALVFLNGIH